MITMFKVKFLKNVVKLSDKGNNKETRINYNTFRLKNTSIEENIKHLIRSKLIFKDFEYVGFSFFGNEYFLILRT